MSARLRPRMVLFGRWAVVSFWRVEEIRLRSYREGLDANQPETWKTEAYYDASALITRVWTLHGVPQMHPNHPGYGGVGQAFYCSHCHMPWPCETARLLINWGETENRDYEPLRLTAKPIDADGSS